MHGALVKYETHNVKMHGALVKYETHNIKMQ